MTGPCRAEYDCALLPSQLELLALSILSFSRQNMTLKIADHKAQLRSHIKLFDVAHAFRNGTIKAIAIKIPGVFAQSEAC